MARRKKSEGSDDPLEPYRRVRKPVAPPARVEGDRRRRIRDEAAEREARDAVRERRGGRGDEGAG
jgi:hypothetical protein